jgi:CubicO group peptidase (beta-lactamase class C family)
LRAKARLGLHQRSEVSLAALPEVFGRPEFARAALDIGDRGVTLLRDAPRLLPLDATRPTRALLVAIAGDPDACPGEDFEREIRWRVDFLHTLRFDTRFAPVTPSAEQAALSSVAAGAPATAAVATGVATPTVPPPESYDVMIVALFVRVADRKGSIGLPNDQAEFVHRLLAADMRGKPVIVVCFGSPYVLARFPEAKTWLGAFSNAGVAQRAAARAMFGEVAIGGRIPVNVPGAAALGDGLRVPADPMTLKPARSAEDEKFAAAFALLDRAVAERAFPGGVVAIGHRGCVSVHAFGKQSYDAGAPAVTPETIYDAASLTKSVVTTTLAAMLVESGELDLDAPVVRYMPEWAAEPHAVESAGIGAGWRGRVTVRHLLTHTSGLPAHEKYFEASTTRREIATRVLAAALVYEPGVQSVYSDLGFIMLGEIIERLTGKSLDELARHRIFEPLRMTETMFQPAKSLHSRIAPTEVEAQFRKRLVHGEVHDENAWAMGGVAGHAGMFTTAGDLAAFCQMLLNGGIYAHRRLLQRSRVAQFTSASPLAANARALGWNVPTPDSSSGRYFSARSFGHTGFTGTSIWVDPAKQLFVVLLTNRVHPSRDNDKINKVRPALHDAIVEALHLQS